MCGRFSLGMDGDKVARLYGGDLAIPWQPRYSIAPSTIVLTLHQKDVTRVLAPARWEVPARLGGESRAQPHQRTPRDHRHPWDVSHRDGLPALRRSHDGVFRVDRGAR